MALLGTDTAGLVLDAVIQPMEVFGVSREHHITMPPAKSSAERRGMAMLLGDMLIGFVFAAMPCSSFNGFFSDEG